MLVPVTAFAVAHAGALVLTPLVRAAAVDAELLDEPGGRKIHARAIPRLGGAAMLVAFGVAVAAGLLASQLTGQELDGVTAQLAPMLVGIALVAAVGLFDDLRDLRPLAKLAGQLLASVAVVALGLSFSDLTTPWFTIHLGAFGPLLTIAWLVAVANAVNLIDGLDGLAGGVSLATLLAFGGISASLDAPMVILVTAASSGAVSGVLV
jgi:UDP-GlcNAc:undecaprenyl-phosphate GlcNAc-1-phosphate transferase